MKFALDVQKLVREWLPKILAKKDKKPFDFGFLVYF